MAVSVVKSSLICVISTYGCASCEQSDGDEQELDAVQVLPVSRWGGDGSDVKP